MYGQPSASGGGGSSRRRRHKPPVQAQGAPLQFGTQQNLYLLPQNSSPRPPHQNRSKERSQTLKDSKDQLLKKVGRAIEEARLKIVGSGESVTSWKVSQEALLMLKVDSWSSLGFSMQEVPNLHRLFVTEGKVRNAGVHSCFF
ncbi:hypothetical protein I3843_01G110500 [Carya illinoinensis]|uniref:Uncharacterized protein n=1 Tax=Carya illinoinensis TaxID=32201 RepID=A0A922G2B2_CARIL|nr:hypothetical protein I3842_01G117300 [Carya illinoinensis]KAG7995460.1 hypothetical protein I3843_01G110500 [Carya illinoinensis]